MKRLTVTAANSLTVVHNVPAAADPVVTRRSGRRSPRPPGTQVVQPGPAPGAAARAPGSRPDTAATLGRRGRGRVGPAAAGRRA